MSQRKLKAWQQAGLIDAETAQRIRSWEAEHSRPIGVWAVAGLGALAIGLGLVSIVAANWDDIPGEVRLGAHLALLAGVAAFLGWRLSDKDQRGFYFSDGLIFITAILGLTFFGHLGQVYQTSSPLWQPLLAWLIIFSPLLLMFGRGWPVAALWLATVLGTAWSHASEHDRFWFSGNMVEQVQYPVLYWGLIACPPMAVATLAALVRERSDRREFWRLLEQLALATIMAGLSIIIIIRGWNERSDYATGSVLIQCLAMIGAAAAIFFTRRAQSGQAAAAILIVAAVIHFANTVTPRPSYGATSIWINAFYFLALWAAAAFAALRARWRWAFQFAIGVLAFRLIILSFELNDDLLSSGFGLVLSGVFAMGVAWITVRISRRYAPKAETRDA